MANATEAMNSTGQLTSTTRHLTWKTYMEIAAHTVAAFFSFTGNLLVVLVYAKNRSGRIRSLNNLLLINLSVVVILQTCNFYTMHIYGLVRGAMRWDIPGIFGLVLCKIEQVFLHGLFLVCQLSVLAIAVERFLVVCFPMNWLVTKTVVRLLIACSWVIGLGVYSPMLYMSVVKTHRGIPRCRAQFIPHITLPWYKAELGVFLAATAALLVIYFIIVCRLYSRQLPGQPLQDQVRRSRRINRKVTLRVAMILSLFYSCWLPFSLLNAFYFADKMDILTNAYYNFFLEFMPFLYGSLCPWVFPLLHEDFRKAMMALLCIHRHHRSRSIRQMQLSTLVQNSVAGTQSHVTTLSIIQ